MFPSDNFTEKEFEEWKMLSKESLKEPRGKIIDPNWLGFLIWDIKDFLKRIFKRNS